MKRSFLLLFAALLALTMPLAPARAQDDSVSIDFFYDALSPDGDWIYTPNYGYVWQPLVAQQPGWSPYADGSWAFTEAGWTWISNEDFGWLTYHYGRWIQMQQAWTWVPGYEWAPAWVSWRQTQGQIGWAPLPPEAAWSPGIGFGNWTDSYYDVGPSYYNFVPINLFASITSLRPFILDRSRNYNYYDQSVNITQISYQKNVVNNIFVGGPDPQRIDGFGNNRVRRLSLHRDDDGFRRNWLDNDRDRRGNGPPRGGSSRIEKGQLFIASPSIRRDDSHRLPPRVRESLNQPVIDRGWRGMGNDQNTDRMRQRQRDELERTRPANLPEKNMRPVTSTAPPPAVGRKLEPHERNDGRKGAPGVTTPQKPDPRSAKEEVRKPGTPKNPMPDGPPGIPSKGQEPPRTPGTIPGAGRPGRDSQTPDRQPGTMPGRGSREDKDPTPGRSPEARPGMPKGPQGGVPQKPDKGTREDKSPTPDRAPEARPGMPKGPQGGVPQKPDKGTREDKSPTPDRAPQTRPSMPKGPQGGVPQRPGRDPRENGATTPGGAPGMRPGLPQVPQTPPQRSIPPQRTPNVPTQRPAMPNRPQAPPSAQRPAERPRMQPQQPRMPTPAPAAPQVRPTLPQQPPAARPQLPPTARPQQPPAARPQLPPTARPQLPPAARPQLPPQVRAPRTVPPGTPGQPNREDRRR